VYFAVTHAQALLDLVFVPDDDDAQPAKVISVRRGVAQKEGNVTKRTNPGRAQRETEAASAVSSFSESQE
jgi:hypothetical protein